MSGGPGDDGRSLRLKYMVFCLSSVAVLKAKFHFARVLRRPIFFSRTARTGLLASLG
jgi:hypothetical protein